MRDDLRRGWCLGSASFRERVLGLLEKSGSWIGMREVDAALKRDHGQEQARRLLQSGLAWCGMKEEEELTALKKNDPRKMAIATLIRRRTTVPNRWIAEVLHLGHVSRVSRCWDGGSE